MSTFNDSVLIDRMLQSGYDYPIFDKFVRFGLLESDVKRLRSVQIHSNQAAALEDARRTSKKAPKESDIAVVFGKRNDRDSD